MDPSHHMVPLITAMCYIVMPLFTLLVEKLLLIERMEGWKRQKRGERNFLVKWVGMEAVIAQNPIWWMDELTVESLCLVELDELSMVLELFYNHKKWSRDHWMCPTGDSLTLKLGKVSRRNKQKVTEIEIWEHNIQISLDAWEIPMCCNL